MSQDDNYCDSQQPSGGYAGGSGADAPPGYGDVQDPASPYDKKPKTAPALDVIAQLKSDLKGVGVGLQGADLIDMKLHSNHAGFEGVNFVAWTNSSTRVFVNLQALQDGAKDTNTGPKNARAAGLVSVRHEIFHVIQFKANGGPPKTLKDMLGFEAEAYAKTLAWMDEDKTAAFLTKTIGATQKYIDGIHSQFADEGAKFEGRTKVNASEKEHFAWLIDKDNEFLPPTIQGKADYAIGDLYKTS